MGACLLTHGVFLVCRYFISKYLIVKQDATGKATAVGETIFIGSYGLN
jgi:hypothetical protein